MKKKNYNLTNSKTILSNKVNSIFSRVFNYLVLAFRTPDTSFRMIVESEDKPLGIDFSSPLSLRGGRRTTRQSQTKAKDISHSVISTGVARRSGEISLTPKAKKVKQAYLKEYLELVHHKKQKKAKLSTFGMVFAVIVISLIISFVTTVVFPNIETTEASGESWLSGYTYRRAVTIEADKVTTTTDTFVTSVTSTIASLKTTGNGGLVTNANGYDIVWTDSDGTTPLNFEVEKYDPLTGEIVHWVQSDVSSTTDKVLYMYYGNSDISTDQSDKNATWASDYVGVWHMNNAFNASSTDSTVNANNGSMKNFYSSTSTVTGIAGSALSFDDSDDYVDVGDIDMVDKITINLWARMGTIYSGQNFFNKTWDGSSLNYSLSYSGPAAYKFSFSFYNSGVGYGVSADTFDYLNGASLSEWFMLTATYDMNQEGNNTKLYKNGALIGQSSNSVAMGTNNGSASMGQYSGAYFFDGHLDEVRISNIAKSAQFIATEYNNQSAVSEFLTFGSEEVANSSPASPTSPTQYVATTTREILNTDYTNKQSIDLSASVTDLDTTETITLFYEVQASATAFDSTATPTTGTSCASGTAIADCATNIWYVTSSSGDYSSTPFTATTTVSGLVEDTSYKWQVKACDDSAGCSSWVAYNATTPNFTRDASFGMASTRSITIDADQVTANLTNFPMLFSTTLDDLKATSTSGRIQKTDATDIVFTTADGTYLDYEIEKYTGTTGELIAWVNVAEVSSTTDTVLNMYYGDLDSVDHSTTTAVWASDYVGVWHFDDVSDSTGYGNNGTAVGNASSTDNLVYSSGKMGEAFAFDGSGDYISIPEINIADDIPMTMSMLFKLNEIVTQEGLVGNIDSTSKIYVTPTKVEVYAQSGITNAIYSTSVGDWHHYVYTRAGGSGNTQNLQYMDGQVIKDQNLATTAFIIDQIGGRGIAAYTINGFIDETRISNTAKTPQWIATEYNNQSSTSTFYTIGVETPNSNPATPTLNQYYGTSNTIIDNGGNISNSTVVLGASATDADTSESLTFYYEVVSTTQSFLSPASPTADTSCASETTREDCSSNIWYASTLHGDFSSTATSTSVTVAGVATSTSMMWQVNVCDDDGGCSGWTAFNASTPNFTRTEYFGNTYYKEITIDADQVTANLTNFPMLYSVTDTNLKATSTGGYVGNLSGNDIMFANSSGEKLYHEIENYDNSTGALTAWVNVTDVSSTTDTVINMYYGSTTLSDQASSTATWASDYAGVWHLGSNDDATDSTSNANNGTAYGNASSTDNLVYNSGKISDAFAFDGTGDYLFIPSNSSLDGGTAFSLSFWLLPAMSQNGNYGVMDIGWVTVGNYGVWIDELQMKMWIVDDLGSYRSEMTASLTEWTHVAFVYNGSSVEYFKNGALVYTDTDVPATAGTMTHDGHIGARRDNPEDFNGTIDETRISNTAKSAQWIATEYNNQSSTSTFYTTGVQQPNVAPSAPTLVSPADASNTTDTTPTLSANYTDADAGDVGTTNYRISSISTQDCLDNGTIVASGTSSETATNSEATTYTPDSSIGDDGTYYWCAQNNDSVAQSSWTTMGSFTLDTTAPTVLNISSDYANGNYTTSTVIDIDVTFSENVTSDGNVTITLETGDSDQTCTFTITSTNTATCDYTTVAGDNSSDLTVGNVSGTITDTAGNTMVDFTPTTNLADNKAIVIDTTAPTSVDIATITADSSSQITVTSVSSTDALAGMHASPYWFNETSDNDGGTDSTSYQGSKTYIDTGLTPNTQYSYQVKAQDLLSNISSYSTVVASTTIYTLANVPSTPALTVNSASKITATWGANSNPSGTNYYIENTTKGTNSGWTTGNSWTSTGLDCNTSYTFQVKAKNGDGVATANSSSVSATTNDCGLASFFMPSLFGGPGSTDSSESDYGVNSEDDDTLVINDPEIVTSDDLTIEDKQELQDLGILPEEEIIIPIEITDAIEQEELAQEENILETLQDTPLVINKLKQDGLELKDLSLEQLDEITQYALLSNDLDNLTKKFPSLSNTLRDTNIDLNTKQDLENIKGVSFTLPGVTRSIESLASSRGNVGTANLAKNTIVTTQVSTPNSFGQITVATVNKATPLSQMSKEVKEQLPEDLVFVRTKDEFIDISTRLEVTNKNKIEKKLNVSSNQDLKLAIKPTNEEEVEGVKGYLVLKDIDRNSMSNLTTKPVKTAWYNSLISPVYAMDLRLPKIHQGGKVLGEQDEIAAVAESLPLSDNNDKEPKELLVLMEFDYLDLDNDGIYTTDIKTPPIEGTFEILTAISYKYQEAPKIVRLTTVIDPEGYVYYIDDETGAKARIKGAKVLLYQKVEILKRVQDDSGGDEISPLRLEASVEMTDGGENSGEWVLWPASEFNQTNPQITTDNGKYSFLVPEGTYYLLVEAENYDSYQSKTFKVEEGNSVHENIELKVIEVWWSILVSWKFWMMIVGLILVLNTTFILLKNKK